MTSFFKKHKFLTSLLIIILSILSYKIYILYNPKYSELQLDIYYYEGNINSQKLLEAIQNTDSKLTVSFRPYVKIPFFNSRWERCTILMLPCLYPYDDNIDVKLYRIETQGEHIKIFYKVPMHSKFYTLSNQLFHINLQFGRTYSLSLYSETTNSNKIDAYPIYLDNSVSRVGGTLYVNEILFKHYDDTSEFQNQTAPFKFTINDEHQYIKYFENGQLEKVIKSLQLDSHQLSELRNKKFIRNLDYEVGQINSDNVERFQIFAMNDNSNCSVIEYRGLFVNDQLIKAYKLFEKEQDGHCFSSSIVFKINKHNEPFIAKSLKISNINNGDSKLFEWSSNCDKQWGDSCTKEANEQINEKIVRNEIFDIRQKFISEGKISEYS